MNEAATLPAYGMTTAAAHIGRQLGVSGWVLVDQARIDQFGACTGDRQWIHVDIERCRQESPFGGPVAHGFLTLSLLANLQMQLGALPPKGMSRAINAGVEGVRFQAPVLAGSRVRARVTLLSTEAKGADRILMVTQNVLEIEGSDKPALTANLVAMVYR